MAETKTSEKKLDVKTMTLTAVFIALVYVVTAFIQIPIPLGYFNIGNFIILTICILTPSPTGIIAGSIGSALADLFTFPVYTVPTLIIKALFPIVFYAICKLNIKNKVLKQIIAAAISTLIPLFGYTATGMIIYGSFHTGLAQFPGLLVEYAANLVLFSVISFSLKNNKFSLVK